MSDIVFSPNLNKLAPDASGQEGNPKFAGPISGPMWKKLSKLNSQYTDTFDYKVYDQLYEKFDEKQPRGGIVYRTNFKLVNHHHDCSKCHYAFELDTYGRGCVHNCVYCYAKDQLTLKGYWNRPHPMPADISEIRKIFYTVFETSKKSKWRELLEQKIPLRIGSMSDSFMWMDIKYRVSYEVLKILKFYQYPYVVFTRSDLISRDEYLKVIDPNIAAIQFSISGDNETLTKQIEPGAPSIKRRMKALKKLNENGIWSTVRINPLFPTFPDGYFTNHQLVEKRFNGNIPQFDLLNIKKVDAFLDQMKEAKVKSFLAGFVRLNQTSISQISRATEIPFKDFFKPENYTNSGESHFTNEEIAHYYHHLASNAHKKEIHFSTCYIGNGLKDYYQYQNLWSNKKDCCDIVGKVNLFKKTSQNIIWPIRLKHTNHKKCAEEVQKIEHKFDENYQKGKIDTSTPKLGNTIKYKALKWDSSQPQV